MALLLAATLSGLVASEILYR
ncbi:MAG: hypothetical protein FD129_65, partial [bacterium]